ncbi:helix-turn-helix protein [Kribbella orskensis]|uniref:Helix-turn-helix protein n=1 Tax=Kribbella orskensis TaxID=2512216 RepID=A0ABY2BUF2_9ACTN|nr:MULTISPECIES: helix-turn-helix domain-containing protein [Kribbella]TCN44600.1 helix-turn-helix protein [Kribbella sp. VKM Ac-2500]TCO31622.1 helix-turn-helix protein [Kribbella orskensis]
MRDRGPRGFALSRLSLVLSGRTGLSALLDIAYCAVTSANARSTSRACSIGHSIRPPWISGASRSRSSARWRTRASGPLDYLARWRIRAAGRALRSTDRTVYSVATEFGYGSESAFSTAFKRVTGQSPARYRQLAR